MNKAPWYKRALVFVRLSALGYNYCGNGKFYKKSAVVVDTHGKQNIYRTYGDDAVIFHHYWDN